MTHFEAFRTNSKIERSDCCWFLGDYYLRPEKMRLQKKYTICLQTHIIVLFRVLDKPEGIVTTTILPDFIQAGHDVVTTNKVTKRNLFTTHCVVYL